MIYKESNLDRKLRKWFEKDSSKQLLKEVSLSKGKIRGLTTFSLNFQFPITAIAGRNGCGKSTILALVCCGFHNKKNGYKLSSRPKTYYTFADFFIQHREETSPQGVNIKYQISHNKWRKTKRIPTGKGLGYQSRFKSYGGRWNDYSSRVNRDVVFLGIERIVPHNEKSQSKSYSRAFTFGIMEGWEEDVKRIVGAILNKNYTDFKYAAHSKYRLPVVKTDSCAYSGFNMGAGENALFEIFSIIYSCSKGALIVIDEIELGLHNEAQKKFIKSLKEVCLERSLQVICTTHSKDIFEELPPDARVYLESINNKTKITNAISTDFAFSKLSSKNSNELTILVEDEVAKSLLQAILPNEIRSRVSIEVIGSATALSRQLAALYLRKVQRPTIVIFDGDQKKLENKNLKHAKDMAELTTKNFSDWFKDNIEYLPGKSWPENWIIEKCAKNIKNLANLTNTEPDVLSDALADGLAASKHSEFYTIGNKIGLDERDILKSCCINISQKNLNKFNKIISTIKMKLKG